MITNFNKYLIQEKSTFSDLLPNEFVSYIHKNYKVSKNKFTYEEIKQEELFHYLTTIFKSDKMILVISKKGPTQSLVIIYDCTNTKNDKMTATLINNGMLLNIYIQDSIGECYKAGVVINNKHRDSINNTNINYINDELKPLIIDYVKKIFLRLKKKNIELDRKVLSEVANEYPEIFIKIVEEVKS